MTWILTLTGKRFELLAPTAAMIDPMDIAHSLAHQCRFNGHSRGFYSVAQHCCIVADLVPEEHQLVALLHDATEAYVGDLVRPLKQLLPAFVDIEHRIWLAICERFNLDTELPACVHDADLIALATERRDLMPAHPGTWECLANIQPSAARIKPWGTTEATVNYFHRLMQLLSTTHRAAA
ncbi:MAG: phosphohydrolase [Pseudomonas sp.]|uniref:phosphohydrolase n=1 Tax=Pseudomonas sp. TaxID=306 RepID=UPI002736CDB1|nr:phosphohydrolase [Pseudomonas sp.]MDP3848594.1 phosphohydrolase [Pseudomonas sp.]